MKSEKYTINNVVINDAIIEEIENIFNVNNITDMMEDLAETIMDMTAKGEVTERRLPFHSSLINYYNLLKAMRTVEKDNSRHCICAC
jgi:hypothetical protein